MALLDQAIIALCATAQPQYNAPCKASLQAGTRQIGIYEQINTGEKVANQIALHDAQQNLGDTTIIVIGGVAFVAKAVQDRGLSFNLPTYGVCDSLGSHVGIGSYGLHMGWKF